MAGRRRKTTSESLDHLPIDILVRVSRSADRDVDSDRYHTEEYQLEQATSAVKERGRAVGEVILERNVSGGTLDRDGLKEVMDRVRAKESGGVAVAYLSRFGRTAGQTILAINEINELGATFITADGKFDTTTTQGRAFLGFMAVLAEMELDRIAENWGSIVGRAIAQGRYVAGAVPVGYLMGADGRLVPNEKKVGPRGKKKQPVFEIVAELFRLRAEEDWSWTMLADWLTEQGVRPNTADMTERKVASRQSRAERAYGEEGWQRWTRQAVRGIIQNPAYKGVARQMREDGAFLNESAHPPIVPSDLWEAAQTVGPMNLNGGRDGSMSAASLLKGVCVCDGCGHRLVITGRFDKSDGVRKPLFYCRGRYATGDCEVRPAIDLAKVEDYVVGQFLEHFGRLAKARRAAKRDKEKLTELQSAADVAQADYHYWLTKPGLAAEVGDEDYQGELGRRRRARDTARTELEQELRRQDTADTLLAGNLLELWPEMTIQERRYVLAAGIDEVRVKSANGRRGKWAPPAWQRVDIVWAGED